MTDTKPQPRHFRPSPSWLIFGLLVIEALLWLSERFQWPVWHKGYAVLTAVAAGGVVFVAMLLWLAIALLLRQRFQFSIRSLLVLTVAVALPCSWLAVEMRAAKKQKEAVEAFRHAYAYVTYQYEIDRPAISIPLIGEGSPHDDILPEPDGPAWLSSLLGLDFFNCVATVSVIDNGGFQNDFGDDDLGRLDALPDLRQLNLAGEHLTEAGLGHLRGLRHLEWLEIVACRRGQFSDNGVAKLQQALPNCRITR